MSKKLVIKEESLEPEIAVHEFEKIRLFEGSGRSVSLIDVLSEIEKGEDEE